MSFSATLTTAGRTATITLNGALDVDGDEAFRDKVDRVAGADLAELVLDMSLLTHLSTAGIRAIAYTRQRMSDDVEVVIAAPSPGVRAVLAESGLDDGIAVRE